MTQSAPERRALFGDLHLHTALSMDAYALGTRTSPDDAYAFARGRPIPIYGGAGGETGKTIHIDRPLDFAAVTDHAEWMAEVSLCTDPIHRPSTAPAARSIEERKSHYWRRFWEQRDSGRALRDLLRLAAGGMTYAAKIEHCAARHPCVWGSVQAAAERWYDRSSDCEFTTFNAWEYSRSPQSTKIHRKVILRNEITPELPISALETPSEMDMRRQLLEQCNNSGSGCDAIAIPHNPNLSNGQLFRAEYADLPTAAQKEEAAIRARLEPVVEMMQIKGESECRNGMYGVVGAEDELCNFEKIRDFGQPELTDCGEGQGKGAQAGKGCTSRNDYVRYALIDGLREGTARRKSLSIWLYRQHRRPYIRPRISERVPTAP